MEKKGMDSSRELQCVGRMEVMNPKPMGFLCGSIPVSTDASFHVFNSALLRSKTKENAPRYRMLPTETDLKVLPIGVHPQSKTSGDVSLGGSAITSNFIRKCEALAVTGLVEYGDEIDVIAPADILKQIFKMPYSKARLSIAVKRIGQTLVLNSGPDVEEGEKLTSRHSCQSKGTDQSLFLNFAMHSVRMEACDCPPSHDLSSDQQSKSSVFPGLSESRDSSLKHSSYHAHEERLHFYGGNVDYAGNATFTSDCHSDCSPTKLDDMLQESKKNKCNKGHEALKKASHVNGMPRCSLKESEKYKRASNEGFLRILFWQFQNFRMLLGSDLLLFSNEKYAAVSLHLWDISRQVTPLTWLEAWLDNMMASVPELAICYHENGVVQGYELLKTDDIFLLKGISEDGTPAFHPHVVQQNGLTVLRFLQENCKQDPGAYWLYKNAGDDAIQLFDLSVPKNHPTNVSEDSSSPFPSVFHRGRSDSKFLLGTLLYRIAHRLSLSMDPNNRSKCAQFFKKCFDFLDEPDHLVACAIAHEQFARVILSYEEELDLTSESFPEESEMVVTIADEELFVPYGKFSQSVTYEIFHKVPGEESNRGGSTSQESKSDGSHELALETNTGPSNELMVSSDTKLTDTEVFPAPSVKNVSDPIASKLAAIHHVSQAIKSLRWRRQLQSDESDHINHGSQITDGSLPVKFSLCVCGDVECIEVCDIREWLPTSKLDHKLWKLVLLLGEAYLALGEAYKDDNQLYQALKVVGLACSVYGSMPQNLDDVRYVSSIGITYRSRMRSEDQSEGLAFEQRSTYLFWAKAWMLVGDVYVEFHKINGKDVSIQIERKLSLKELRMSPEVVKEVTRLRKQLGQVKSNCSFCSLVNCSCQSDRADSGSSASSSSGDSQTSGYGRKHSKRFHSRSPSSSFVWKPEGHLNDKGIVCSKNGHGTMEHSNIANHKDDTATFGAIDYEEFKTTMQIEIKESVMPDESEAETPGKNHVGNGSIFRYLEVPLSGTWDYYLITALSCYDEARKALDGLSCGLEVLQAVVKKKGWVCNELGRNRLERKELEKAELAFAEAIRAFREASDFTNIVLINCNLGHGRRSLAEEIVSQITSLKEHLVFQNAYNNALKTARQEYARALKYYMVAKSELKHLTKGIDPVVSSLKNEVYTQLGHTYLRFGMLLASEDSVAVVDVNTGDASIHCCSAAGESPFIERKKHEISANYAIREAVSAYESLGNLRVQEIAYAYFQLACYQRDCCLKFLIPDNMRRTSLRGGKSNLQRLKQYASLADINWLRAMDFYGPKTHPTMYLTILLERSALSLSLSSILHSNSMMESALCSLLEGRLLVGNTCLESWKEHKICAKFWNQLQMLLKTMLATTKPCPGSQTPSSNNSGEVGKLRELYKMSLRSTDFNQLQEMHCLWADQSGSLCP